MTKSTKSPIDDLLEEDRRIRATDLSATRPRCHKQRIVRSGHVRGRQRYQCQDCHYHFSTVHRGKSPALKRMALHLYLEGNGLRSIGRLLGVSNVAVLNWIHHFGESLGPIRKPEDEAIEIVEIDEMYSFIQQKKPLLDLDRCGSRASPKTFKGLRFLGFVLGSRDERTGRRLWEQLDGPDSCFPVMTDYGNAYPRVIPWSVHTASKAQTYTVEGYNSNVRHFLARMHRKTKCYSKSEMILYYSLRLWMAKWNGALSILIWRYLRLCFIKNTAFRYFYRFQKVTDIQCHFFRAV